jgi:tRNA(Ile)-lysidine synthase
MRNLDFDTLERASLFVETNHQSIPPDQMQRQVDLSGGLRLYREGEAIYLAALEADLPTANWPVIDKVHELPVNGQVRLNENFVLSANEVDAELARSVAYENGDPFIAWVDADRMGNSLMVRAKRPGDVFSPLGMNRQTVKLREFYINVKIPRRARNGWPLVCAEEQIVWVPGFRLAHPFRINEKTKRVVKLTLQAG